jgi:hypothetical protein
LLCELARLTYITEARSVKETKNLAGSKFRVDEDFAWETRKIRKRLIPYLKDAKRRGHREIR